MSTARREVYVSLEFTPNPNTLKYMVSEELLPKGAANFKNLEEAKGRSPLAEKLLSAEGVAGVMIGRNFVTVTKSDEGDWDAVHELASKMIEKHLEANEPVLTGEAPLRPAGKESEIETKILEILDNEIRPAVAMDGGDITFDRYEDGVVYLHLQGACAGCPGAAMTLKMGVENRLREAIPEIREVVPV